LEAVPYHIAKGSALFFRRFGIRIYIMLRICLLPLFVIAFTSAVFAETTIVLNPNEKPMASATPTPQVRVSVNVNAFVPAPAEDREQGFKAQEQGRRMIYDLADYECAVLRDVLASDCQLESINVNVQRVQANQFPGQQKAEGFNVNGNIGFRIVPK
jgi:hypothetical protein